MGGNLRKVHIDIEANSNCCEHCKGVYQGIHRAPRGVLLYDASVASLLIVGVRAQLAPLTGFIPGLPSTLFRADNLPRGLTIILVAASLVGSAQGYYDCTSKSQCQYEGCQNRGCACSPDCNGITWCVNGIASVSCGGYCYRGVEEEMQSCFKLLLLCICRLRRSIRLPGWTVFHWQRQERRRRLCLPWLHVCSWKIWPSWIYFLRSCELHVMPRRQVQCRLRSLEV
jgi:hypothetical protein